MNSARILNLLKAVILAFSLTFASITLQALAQNSSPAQEGGGASTQTNRTTTTTTSSQPQQTTTTTWVDPLWLVLGGVALLAIILIVVLASRGRRGTDRVATHVERETVIKKE